MITVSDNFHKKAKGQLVHPIAKFYISFNKELNSETSFFTLDTSTLDGSDILKGKDDLPIQLWDKYVYRDYTDRLVSLDIERSIEFPYNVQFSQSDIKLDNFDKYFNPDGESVVAQHNLPNRPIRIFGGFANETLIPQFVGLTQDMPTVDVASATVSYHALDFLSEICKQDLNKTIAMQNVTTDQILAKIVEQFGVLPHQYNFEKGANIIPFVFFDIGDNAGDAIKKLMQAEGGRFWLDEQGILRFKKRASMESDPVMVLSDYSIVSITPKGSSSIINHVKITAEIREVQEFQEVFQKNPSADSISSSLWVVPAGGNFKASCGLADPCLSVVIPELGKSSNVSWFTAKTSAGNYIHTGVTATGSLSTNSYEISFKNDNLFPVEIDELILWGQPAKIIDVLDYNAYEDESVKKYGERVLHISDNNFIQNYNSAQNLGVFLLKNKAFYNQELELEIKGDWSLQLGDLISLEGRWEGIYSVSAISYHLSVGEMRTLISVCKTVPIKFFTLDKSTLDGADVLS